MVDFVLKIISELGTLATETFWEPNTDTLTNDTDNQLVRRIWSKIVRGLGAELLAGGIGSVASDEAGGLGGQSFLHFDEKISAYVPNDFKQKKIS